MQGTCLDIVCKPAITVGIVLLTLLGCASTVPEIVAVPPEPVPEIIIVADEPAPPPDPAPTPIPKAPPVRALPEVAIVLTSRDPAYEDVAVELGKHLPIFTIFDLSDNSQTPVTTFRKINDSSSKAVVAIGLRAAQSSVAMAEVPVVFSQVFNYQDHKLLIDSSRGIASLPPLDAQLAAWKAADTAVSRIGVIIGPGHEALLEEAKLAAEKHDIELQLRIVNSDRETLYYFNRMIRDIDGFWLFPDNRVLSGPVLQKMLAEANRRHVHVAVPNESLLAMGAAISFSSMASDIAAKIVGIVREIDAGNINRIPALSELSEIRVVVNDELINQAINTTSAAITKRAKTVSQ